MKISYFFSAIIVLIELSSCTNPSGPGKDAEMKKKVIENDGVRIDYEDIGLGDTTLLFVHGWCINKSYWKNQVDYFNGKYRVVTMDLPGFGESGKNRTVWTTEKFGEDVNSLMDGLDLKNVILIGHSMAGDIVLEAAVHNPKRVIGLIGVDNFKDYGHVQSIEEKKEFQQVMDLLRHHFTETAYQYFNEALFSKTTADSIKKRILLDVAHADSVIATDCLAQNDYDENAKLSALKKKLILINSDVVPTDSSGFVTNHIPYQIYYIHGTGHYPMIEDPAAFNDRLEKAIVGF